MLKVNKFEEAVKLREEGKLEKAKEILDVLYLKNPNDPNILYQYAWLLDKMGKEEMAIHSYKKAIKKGLQGDELANCMFGLGSSYRQEKKYENSLKILTDAATMFPEKDELKLFKILTHYELGEVDLAFKLLLDLLLQINNLKKIQNYHTAIKSFIEENT